jgi:hypothetical protein
VTRPKRAALLSPPTPALRGLGWQTKRIGYAFQSQGGGYNWKKLATESENQVESAVIPTGIYGVLDYAISAPDFALPERLRLDGLW